MILLRFFGWNRSDFIKAGAPARERVSGHNRLLKIEEELRVQEE